MKIIKICVDIKTVCIANFELFILTKSRVAIYNEIAIYYGFVKENDMQFRTKYDGNMQKEYLSDFFILAIVFCVLGGIGFVAYLITDVVLEVPGYSYLFISVIPMGVGIGFLFIRVNAVKNCDKINRENEYTFHDDYFEIKTFYRGDEESSSKLYYSDIFKIKETKGYFFVVQDRLRMFPIKKNNAPDVEVLRKLIYSGGAKRFKIF